MIKLAEQTTANPKEYEQLGKCQGQINMIMDIAYSRAKELGLIT